MALHPCTRILLLLAFATALAFASLKALVLLCVLLPALALSLRADPTILLRAVWRLRWLCLAITAVYFVLPGAEGFSQWPEALRRCLILLLLAASVAWLNATTAAPQLAAALLRLLQPLRAVGVDAAPFGRRLALTLHAVEPISAKLAALRERGLRNGLAATGELIQSLETQAHQPQPEAFTRQAELTASGLRDWLTFAVTLGLLLGIVSFV